MRYEYKIVKIPFTGSFKVTLEDDMEELINVHGAAGWRLVQVFAPQFRVSGEKHGYDLIFEKPIQA